MANYKPCFDNWIAFSDKDYPPIIKTTEQIKIEAMQTEIDLLKAQVAELTRRLDAQDGGK